MCRYNGLFAYRASDWDTNWWEWQQTCFQEKQHLVNYLAKYDVDNAICYMYLYFAIRQNKHALHNCRNWNWWINSLMWKYLMSIKKVNCLVLLELQMHVKMITKLSIIKLTLQASEVSNKQYSNTTNRIIQVYYIVDLS